LVTAIALETKKQNLQPFKGGKKTAGGALLPLQVKEGRGEKWDCS
jgi:hypothetical protein